MVLKGYLLCLAALVPVFAAAQRTFTYAPKDPHTLVLTAPGRTSITVTTTIIVLGSRTSLLPTTGQTQALGITMRPPESGARLLDAILNGQTVNVAIVGMADGEIKGMVQSPVKAGPTVSVVLQWETPDGIVETMEKAKRS